MLPLMVSAFLAGVAGSPHCLGMCGPFAMACADRPSATASWHLGRILTYGLLGGVAGTLGVAIPGPSWLAAGLSLLLVTWFAAALAGLVPEPKLPLAGLPGWAAKWLAGSGVASRFAFGLANGLLPCGLVYAALGMSLAAASPLWGSAAMAAFGLGTVPALTVAATLRRVMTARLWSRRMLAGMVFLTALWVIGQRAGWWVALR